MFASGERFVQFGAQNCKVPKPLKGLFKKAPMYNFVCSRHGPESDKSHMHFPYILGILFKAREALFLFLGYIYF